MARGNLLPFGFGSQRGDPFQLLRREMEQLFDNVGGNAGEAWAAAATSSRRAWTSAKTTRRSRSPPRCPAPGRRTSR